jgi:hypothetical protein
MLPIFVPAMIALPDALANLFSKKKENSILEEEVI